MYFLFLLACDPPPPPAPPPEQVQSRISLRSLTEAGANTPVELPQAKAVVEQQGRGCGVDIDMRKVSLDDGFKEQEVTGTWGRFDSEPFVLHDPTTGCVLIAPGKLTLEIPAELGCERAVLELNAGCGADCGYARGLRGGKTVAKWQNSGTGKEMVELKGNMDEIEIWSSGMEICRVQLF